MDNQMMDEVLRLRKAGFTYRAIAAQLGSNPMKVQRMVVREAKRLLFEMGWTVVQASDELRMGRWTVQGIVDGRRERQLRKRVLNGE